MVVMMIFLMMILNYIIVVFNNKKNMEDLIKALNIFLKYKNSEYPTYCIDEILYVNVSPTIVTEEDKIILNKLGFRVNVEEDCFLSIRFGSY